MVLAHRYFHIGHRGCTKTYGYVGNSVYQIKEILLNPTTNRENKVFYIGDNPPYNIEEWANEISHEINHRIIRMPLPLLKLTAFCGDMLRKLGIAFPMTSFRLRNMTTDNVMDLSNTSELAPHPPYSRIEGIKNTLVWIRNQK